MRADGETSARTHKARTPAPALTHGPAQCAGWGPGQLQREVSQGVWHPVSAARQLALKQVLGLPKPLWREVSELVGGSLAADADRAGW